VNERESDPIADVIEVEVAPGDPATAPGAAPVAEQPRELPNPDVWLHWALVIGLLALFLICALLILIAWADR